MKNIKTRKELDSLNGKRVKINSQTAGYNTGDIIEIKVSKSSTVAWPQFICPNGKTMNSPRYFDLMPGTKEDIRKELAALDSEYKRKKKSLESKISYLEESNASEYSDDEFVAYKAIKEIESNPCLTSIEKARLLLSSMK